MILSKVMIEQKARRALGDFCNYPIENLNCADKPDLQDIICSYGIEVVEDCYSNERKAERFIEDIQYKPYDEIDPQKIKKLEKLGGSLQAKNNKVVWGSLGPSMPNNPAHLIETIKGKIEKLNSGNYKHFDTYGLYVFVETVSLFDSYVHSVIEEISTVQIEKRLTYDTIYLDGTFEMCVCNMSNKTFIRIPTQDRH